MHAERTALSFLPSIFLPVSGGPLGPTWRALRATLLGLGPLLCGHAHATVAAPPICAAYSAFLMAPAASCGHQAVYAAMADARGAYTVAQADAAKDPLPEADPPSAAPEARATPAGTKARCELLEARAAKLEELVRKNADEPTVAWALQEKERARAEAARLGC